jgi:F-type H+-transporting ATPase subunit delta
MAELLTLARPYAKAAFAYASEQNATDSWSNALNLLSAAVQDEAFSAFLNRPELTPAEQVSLFAKVLGEDQTAAVSNFLTLLAENNRLAFFLKLLQNTSSSNHRITILWM